MHTHCLRLIWLFVALAGLVHHLAIFTEGMHSGSSLGSSVVHIYIYINSLASPTPGNEARLTNTKIRASQLCRCTLFSSMSCPCLTLPDVHPGTLQQEEQGQNQQEH